jgi:hypothetical protein
MRVVEGGIFSWGCALGLVIILSTAQPCIIWDLICGRQHVPFKARDLRSTDLSMPPKNRVYHDPIFFPVKCLHICVQYTDDSPAERLFFFFPPSNFQLFAFIYKLLE